MKFIIVMFMALLCNVLYAQNKVVLKIVTPKPIFGGTTKDLIRLYLQIDHEKNYQRPEKNSISA